MNAYIVTWKRKPYALPFLIDFSDEALAIKCAVALNEIGGRYDVALTSADYEVEPMDPALKERIWARVKDASRESLEVFA